ncbi:MAG: hypothetical protein HUJ91_07065 [Bacteroidales bacterium]|nr:hypothetical protein [Bacteroidales bacterium]
MNKRITIIIAALALSFVPKVSNAQENIAYDAFSPYSIYGLGLLEMTGDQNTLAMGGIGIGDRSAAYINLLNPAAVTCRDIQGFMLDFGISQKNIFYEANRADGSGKATSVSNLCNIHHVVASFPITRKIAFQAGVMPFSSTGYYFQDRIYEDQVIVEIGDVQYAKQGKGGTYQCFLGAGWEVAKNLNIGAEGILYLGNTEHSSVTAFTTNSSYRTIQRSWDIVSRGFGAKLGAQYTADLGKNTALTLGATYKVGSKLKGEQNLSTIATSGTVDTIASTPTTIKYRIPCEVGAGFTLRKNDRWMVGADYVWQNWSGSTFDPTPGIDFSTCQTHSVKIGGELTPSKYDIRYYMRRVTYRAGAYYNQGYMAIGGTRIDSRGVTLGASFPVFTAGTSLALAIDLGQMGTLSNNMIRERYVKFTMGLNLYDVWFKKSLYN